MGNLMSTIKANDLQTTTGGIPTVKGQRLIPTAWVNFNGTGTVAIRDSENVSSITDNGTSDYTVTFSTAMANVNFSAVASTGYSGTNPSNKSIAAHPTNTTSVRLEIYNTSGVKEDLDYVGVIILGGQA